MQLIEAKTSALTQSDRLVGITNTIPYHTIFRLLTELRARQTESDDSMYKLRNMLKDAERRCEELSAYSTNASKEVASLSNDYALLRSELASNKILLGQAQHTAVCTALY